MTKILFVCYGNICRSPMAEFILKSMVKKAELENQFQIDSAGISDINNGHPMHRDALLKLKEHGIACTKKTARQLCEDDYGKYDLLIGMDWANLLGMRTICGGDPDEKMHRLLDYADREGEEIADPWYTGDFETAWKDIEEGCRGLLLRLSDQTNSDAENCLL